MIGDRKAVQKQNGKSKNFPADFSSKDIKIASGNFIFTAELDRIITQMKNIDAFYQQQPLQLGERFPPHLRVLTDVQKNICNIGEMNRKSLSSYEELLKKIKTDLGYLSDPEKKLWKKLLNALRFFQSKGVLECIAAYQQFDYVVNNHPLLRPQANVLLQEIIRFKRMHPGEFTTIKEALTRSATVVENPKTYTSYVHYAERVEGRASLAYRALGYTMKAFGAATLGFGLFTMALGVLLMKPSGFTSAGIVVLGMICTSGGFALWEHGKDNVQKGHRRGLSEKLGFFATAVHEVEHANDEQSSDLEMTEIKRPGRIQMHQI